MRSLALALLFFGCGFAEPEPATEPLKGTSEDDPLMICLERCGGCCDANGRCFTGNTNDACGSGSLCTTCSASQTCSIGRCRAQRTTTDEPTEVTPPRVGEISLRWRFSSQACAVVRDVTQVTIDIPGLVLANRGIFPCTSGAIDGVDLLAVQPDLYRYTARGLGADGRLLYETSGSFSVNGPVLVRLDLKPVTGATGTGTVAWKLPSRSNATSTCAALGISTVAIITSGFSTVTVPCDTAHTTLSRLQAGTRTVAISALDANGYELAAGQATVTIVAGAETFSEIPLSWTIGSLPLQWSLSNRGLTQTCQQAGISQVYVNLFDEAGTRFLYEGAGVTIPCANGSGRQETNFPSLRAGRYTVYVQAVTTTGALYASQGLSTTVRAGVFPTTNVSLVLNY